MPYHIVDITKLLKQVLLARENDVESPSGLSSMLLYHATIIIHGQKSIPAWNSEAD